MERRKSERIDDILHRFLREEGLETPINQHRLISMWPKVVGEEIGRSTEEIFIKNQTLMVRLSSPILKSELLFSRSSIVSRLNQMVQANVIVDIRLL